MTIAVHTKHRRWAMHDDRHARYNDIVQRKLFYCKYEATQTLYMTVYSMPNPKYNQSMEALTIRAV